MALVVNPSRSPVRSTGSSTRSSAGSASPPLGPADGSGRGRGPLRAQGGPARPRRGGRLDRGPGRHAHDLGRAQGRAGAQGARLVPHRALLRELQPLADAAGGHRPRGDHGELPPRRPRGADPEARGAQAAPGGDQGRRGKRRRARRGGQRQGGVASARRSARGSAACERSLNGSTWGPLGRAASPRRAWPRPSPGQSPARPRRLFAVPPAFEITARDGAARAGVIHTPHGDVRTPAFVPLASTATVKSLHAAEVAELGYEMVLGNTFHLFIQPGPDLVARAGRAARVHGLARGDRDRLGRLPGVLDGPRVGRGGDQAAARPAPLDDRLDRGGGRALPLLPRRARALHGPGDLDGGPGGARLGHRAGVRRVHALPRRARLHRALDGAHPSLARPLRRAGTPSTRPRASSSTGSCRAGSRGPAERVDRVRGASPARRASRSAGRSARRRSRCARWSGGRSRPARRSGRATCSGSATWTTSSTLWPPASTASTAPRPRGWRATARRSSTTPPARWRLDLSKAAHRTSREPIDAAALPRLPRAHARLPPLPDPRRRADRQAPAHAPQPDLHAAADARPARRDPGRRARRARPGGAGRRDPRRVTAARRPPLLAGRALQAARAADRRRGGGGLRDRRRRGRALLRAAAGRARDRDARAGARHRRRRGERPQRRLSARGPGGVPQRRPRAYGAATPGASTPARSRRRRRSTRWRRSSGRGTRCGGSGSLRVSSSEEEAEHVRRHVAALREDGFPGQLLERDELPPALRRSALERAA